MYYLSQLTINARQQPTSRYEYHQLVAAGFPADHGERVLFRIELDNGFPSVIVQSPIRPSWKTWPTGAIQRWESKQVVGEIKTGQVFVFRLDANPSVTKMGKRYGLYATEAQKQWITERMPKHGASLLTDPAITTPPLPLGGTKKGRPITLAYARIEGLVRVENAALLMDAIGKGIGSGKAFGLGLLSLAVPKF